MERDKLRISCFDADFIPFYVCHNKKDEPIKTLEDCIAKCDDLINNINNIVKADCYIGFVTVGKCFRYGINTDYKAKRKYDNLPQFLPEVKLHMQNNHHFSFVEGYESDDLVVSYKKLNNDCDVIIISPDKDILMSVDIAFNPRKLEWIANSNTDIMVNFWTQMITGDQVDGIKGIPGKGVVAAKSIVNPSKLVKHDHIVRANVLDAYIDYYGEYEGIKEFSKNYLSLKMVDNVELKNIKINEIRKPELL